MKALIFKGYINITPCPRNIDARIYVKLKKPMNKYSENLCYTDIEPGQKVYQLPCDRKNIIGLFIR